MEKEDNELLEIEAMHQMQSHSEKRMDRDVDVFTGQAQQRRQIRGNKAIFTAQSSNQHTVVTIYQTKKKKTS